MFSETRPSGEWLGCPELANEFGDNKIVVCSEITNYLEAQKRRPRFVHTRIDTPTAMTPQRPGTRPILVS